MMTELEGRLETGIAVTVELQAAGPHMQTGSAA